MEDSLYYEASYGSVLSSVSSYLDEKIRETTRRVKTIVEDKLMNGGDVGDLRHLISMTILDVFAVTEAERRTMKIINGLMIDREKDGFRPKSENLGGTSYDVIEASNHDYAVGANVSLFQTRPNDHDMTSSGISEVEKNLEEEKMRLANEIMWILHELKRMESKKLSAEDEALRSLEEAMLHFWL